MAIFNNLAFGNVWSITPFGLNLVKSIHNKKIKILESYSDYFKKFNEVREEKEEENKDLEVINNTLIFRVEGVLVPTVDFFDKLMGMNSIFEIINDFETQLTTMSNIKRVIIYFNTPGGALVGIREFAEVIRSFSKEVEIIAYSNIEMCSAGYWLASSCDRIYSSQSAIVGSIGVKIVLMKETSNYYDLITFEKGDLKSAGDPNSPLTMKEMKHFIDWIEKAYNIFVGDVAKWREKPIKEVTNTNSLYSNAMFYPWFVDEIIDDINDLII